MKTQVESHEDLAELDELIRNFYRVICFEDGGAPDFESMRELFSPHAHITRVTPEGVDYLDVLSFASLVRELLELGAFTSFHEQEVRRNTQRFGCVFHVASAYETRVNPGAIDYLERGVNSLQVLREQGGLRIISLCWDSGSHAPDGQSLFN
jgi:hypothetical protein